jgi:hypothetical protein
MTSRILIRSAFLLLFGLLFMGIRPAAADSSHARIVRLSLVQGDVRFTRDVHGDPLSDPKAVWETGILNLPIRQGYVLATDNGHSEVEFENGAMAFLDAHTVLEFYDLSLHDGAMTTRLVLRQGTASFYVHPGSGDYFSVTGGDFTVDASGRATFRIDNFDDGSTVNVLKGRVSVLHDKDTTPLEKGQSLSMRAGNLDSVTIGRLSNDDDFDRWVSGRIDSVATATNASLQYASSPYYSSGFGDLYTYGSWFPIAGFGYGWQPFGAGFGWSPFNYGSWFYDPWFGWSFVGYQPWGWVPYHYGSWIFAPGRGWVWVPSGFGPGRPISWHPVTGVWVHTSSKVGLVPLHPADKRGKAPINLAQGVLPANGRGVAEPVGTGGGEKWKVLKTPPRDALSSSVAASAPPTRVSRTVLAGNSGARVVTMGRDSSIAYDPHEHRFVNTNASSGAVVNTGSSSQAGGKPGIPDASVAGTAAAAPPAVRSNAPPPASRMAITPPPARPSIRPSGGGGARVGGGSSRGGGGGRSSAPTSAPRSSSPPASHPSGGPTGRPH